MTDYWTNFAKTGNPNGSGLPTWPQYNTASQPTLTLDDQIGGITGYHDQQCALLDSITEPFPAPWAPGTGPTGFAFGLRDSSTATHKPSPETEDSRAALKHRVSQIALAANTRPARLADPARKMTAGSSAK
jgi:hypothetical protein